MRDKWDEIGAAVDSGDRGDSKLASRTREMLQLEKQSKELEGSSWTS